MAEEPNPICERLGFPDCTVREEHVHITNPFPDKPRRAYAVHAPGTPVRGRTFPVPSPHEDAYACSVCGAEMNFALQLNGELLCFEHLKKRLGFD